MTLALVLLLAAAAPVSELTLTSDAFELDAKARQGHAAGGVHAVNEAFDVTADEAVATYDRRSGGAPVVTDLTLTGHVHALRLSDGVEATGGRAVWDRRSGRLELSETPAVRRGEALVEGARIVLMATGDRVDVEAPVVTAPSRTGGQARMTARALTVTQGGERAVFTGGVHFVDGPRESRSATLDARLTRGPKDALTLVRAHLVNDVRLRDGTLRSVSEEAVYEAELKRVTLTGEPRVSGPDGELTGARIVYDARSGRARSERARVRLKESRR
ncbi:MAG: LptA/(LptD N-terminal domain) transport protein [Pseudomonadota bacterium]|jgi:lipopolysaccharide export system protein LptA